MPEHAGSGVLQGAGARSGKRAGARGTEAGHRTRWMLWPGRASAARVTLFVCCVCAWTCGAAGGTATVSSVPCAGRPTAAIRRTSRGVATVPPRTAGLKEFFHCLPEHVRKPAVNGFAAACAGTAAVVVATPIETIKVALQTWPGSTLRSVVPRIAARGTRGFFTGLDAMLIANVPYSLVFYGCYQPIRDGVNRLVARSRGQSALDARQGGAAPATEHSAAGQFVAGGLSDMIGMTIFIPGELVRMRMMHDPARYTSFFQAVPQIVRQEGVSMLFRRYRCV